MKNILEKIINNKKQSLELIKKDKSLDVLEKNIKYQKHIKKINKKIILIKKIDKKINNIDLVVISTPMSEYQKIIVKLNKNLSNNSLITDVGSTRENVSKLIKEIEKIYNLFSIIYPYSINSYFDFFTFFIFICFRKIF